jgi:hypothetical protein
VLRALGTRTIYKRDALLDSKHIHISINYSFIFVVWMFWARWRPSSIHHLSNREMNAGTTRQLSPSYNFFFWWGDVSNLFLVSLFYLISFLSPREDNKYRAGDVGIWNSRALANRSSLGLRK